jgi:allantoinase
MNNSHLELVVRGGRVVTPTGVQRIDFGVALGRIVKVAPKLGDDADLVLDAKGSYIFPGIIDAHVHFNEPGRADWEGLATGSAALAAGGGTCFFDMPLNSEPPVLDAAHLREKRLLAEEKSCIDFALWGGLVPGNLDKLAGLRDAGAIGLKAFMCDSGIASFPRVDEKVLREGMKRAAKLGLLVAVHAEDETLAAKFTAEQKAKGKHDAKAFLASRPVEVELAAIRTAIELSGETGCALHIVHVSSPEGIALIADARDRRVDVTAETCPHYLLLTDKDVLKHGAIAKCAPPLRDEKRRAALWEELRAGNIQTIGSDHSPAPADLKTSDDFFAAWGGIAGCQHGFELLFSEVSESLDKDLPLLAGVLARNVARRFRIDKQKGSLAEGFDADFTVITPTAERVIHADDLWTRHLLSAYAGRKSRMRITHTFVRGQCAWADRRPMNPAPKGKFIRPH